MDNCLFCVYYMNMMNSDIERYFDYVARIKQSPVMRGQLSRYLLENGIDHVICGICTFNAKDTRYSAKKGNAIYESLLSMRKKALGF